MRDSVPEMSSDSSDEDGKSVKCGVDAERDEESAAMRPSEQKAMADISYNSELKKVTLSTVKIDLEELDEFGGQSSCLVDELKSVDY